MRGNGPCRWRFAGVGEGSYGYLENHLIALLWILLFYIVDEVPFTN